MTNEERYPGEILKFMIKLPSLSRNDDVTLLLLFLYFFVRITATGTQIYLKTYPNWLQVGLGFAFYTIICFLILVNQKKIENFNFDLATIAIFFLFGTLFRIRNIDSLFTLGVEVLFLLISVITLIVLIKNKICFKKSKIFTVWFFVGLFSGLLLAFLATNIDPLYVKHEQTPNIMKLISYITFYQVYFLGSGGILEEPVFRGFLWGFLKNNGMKENKIIFIQAGLFWLSHINAIDNPVTFWIVTPTLSLLLGFLVFKSKSIIPPMIAHVMYNSYIATFVRL